MKKSPILRKTVEGKQRQAKQRSKRSSETAGETAEQQDRPSAPIASFAVDINSYELRDTWILDSGANSHVCNDRRRFKFVRMAAEGEELIAGKSVYPIEAFGSVLVTIQSPNGPARIELLDVALVPGFFTNTASLHRFTAKGVHWDTQKQRLHQDGKTFCYIQRVGDHWALEHIALPTERGAISSYASSRDPRKNIEATAERWHALLGHPGNDALAHLQENVIEAVVTSPTSKRTPCEPCALSRAQRVISRRSEVSEAAETPLARVAYDLISLDMAYNENKWISHFRCYFTGMDFVYSHTKKSQTVEVIEKFLNTVKTR